MIIDERYERQRAIGSGGSSRVWLAHDTFLDRPVALKQLGLSPGTDEPDAERAEREARHTAQVRHPHVVVVFDVVKHDGSQWLVMEHVEGTTLGRLCAPAGLDSARVARLMAPVADALATAHGEGVVHRDVKPSNILVAQDDVAKLGDFGVARRHDDVALTRTGLITGSPGYVAPEVALGRTANAASDVFAFGATLYHACTGAPAFTLSDDPIESLEHIVRDDPPQLPADHPLAAMVASALDHDPDHRPTARELSEWLSALADGVQTTAPAPGAAVPEPSTTGSTDVDASRRRGGAHAAPRRRSRAWSALTSLGAGSHEADAAMEEVEQIVAGEAGETAGSTGSHRSDDTTRLAAG